MVGFFLRSVLSPYSEHQLAFVLVCSWQHAFLPGTNRLHWQLLLGMYLLLVTEFEVKTVPSFLYPWETITVSLQDDVIINRWKMISLFWEHALHLLWPSCWLFHERELVRHIHNDSTMFLIDQKCLRLCPQLERPRDLFLFVQLIVSYL